MAGRLDIEIRQGETFEKTYQWLINGLPVNLGGYAGKAQLRFGSTNPEVAAEFEVTIIDAINGRYKLKLTADQTAAIQATGFDCTKAETYAYDVCFSITDNRYRAQEGLAKVSPGITKLGGE